MIEVGKGGQREVEDYHLSRLACYLIAQNDDVWRFAGGAEKLLQEIKGAELST